MGSLLPTLLLAAGIDSAAVASPAVAPSERAQALPGTDGENLVAVDPSRPGRAGDRLMVRALRLTGTVTVDGALSEPVWQDGSAFTELVQRDPVEGARPSQHTEIRIAYDEHAIYVGARLHDTAPDSIVARLARRDVSIASDRFALYLDPYHDRWSGYYFMVNAAGTLYDGTLSNDVDTDKSWDGVWDGSARTDDQGWTVEIRIPYSQLRFSRSEPCIWGVNFAREIARYGEKDFAVYRPRKESGFVSRFPDLVGIENIAPGQAIEIMPYVTTQIEYAEHAPHDPFNDGSQFQGSIGGDLRARMASLTLSATANPDFGQVDVDPATVNLTDVESFFEEKRPFFVDGSSTYHFGRQGAGDYWDYDWDDPLFFYSRRIGRTPQGRVPKADYSEVPVATRILAAAKLSGRLSPRWSLGTLHALTRQEWARLADSEGAWHTEIEPLTYYGVTRAQRDFGGRRAGLGLLGTAALRSFEDPRLRDQINGTSLLGGLDGWVFLDSQETWVLSGWSAVSHVQATTTRMTALQRSSNHYFQRPDAGHVEVDSSATSLQGCASRYWLNKQKGATQINLALGFVSPAFDVNDLGYQNRSDLVNGHLATGYKWTRANRLWRYQTIKSSLFATHDYGGNPTRRGLQVSSYTEFHNRSTLSLFATRDAESMNNRRTRGGPLMLERPAVGLGANFLTDPQRRSSYYASGGGETSVSGSWNIYLYPGMEWRPASTFSMKVTPGWERLREDAQYVTVIADTTADYGRRYVFATLDQRTASMSLHLNWTFTPRLSLQTYLQPFVSSARYRDYKSLARPGSYEFVPTEPQANRDFTVRSLKGNAVLRWEYRPGSALFLVWTQKRSASEPAAAPSLRPDRVVDAVPENVFLAKLSYYFTR